MVFKAIFFYFVYQMYFFGRLEADKQEHAMLCDPIHPISSKNKTKKNIVYKVKFNEDINTQAAVTKLFNRPGVAGAGQQSPPLLIN